MGIMMPETCWVNLKWINIFTCVIRWFFLLLLYGMFSQLKMTHYSFKEISLFCGTVPQNTTQVKPEDGPVQGPKHVVCIIKTPPHCSCVLTLPTFICSVTICVWVNSSRRFELIILPSFWRSFLNWWSLQESPRFFGK